MFKKNIKIISLCLMFALILGCTLTSAQVASAKTQELHATLMQKSNPIYRKIVKNNAPVAYKVKIKKKTIVIHGSLSNGYDDRKQVSNIGVHTYKLSSNIKYVSRGGEAPDQKMKKKEFKKYLKRNADSGLGLVLEFKQNKVAKVAIAS